jgi:hypothetical protein
MKLFTIGCSFTEGQELKDQVAECYTTKLSEQLKLEYYNFGSCGMSNDYIFRKVFELLNSNIITKDDIILIQWTHYMRKELPIKFSNKNFYYQPPNCLLPLEDKILFNEYYKPCTQNEYFGEDIQEIKSDLIKADEEFLNKYSLKFLNEDYQINTTSNYINSLYTYLEHFGYKHLHFFGWQSCVIKSVFDNKSNFIKENFGKYTKTPNDRHPNKKAHEIWANFLFEKIKDFSFANEFDYQLDNYRKNLIKLKVEIELELEKNIEFTKKQKEAELEETIKKIKNRKERELEIQIDFKKEELEKIENLIKNNIKKTKPLI